MNINRLSEDIINKYGNISKSQLNNILLKKYHIEDNVITEKVLEKIQQAAVNISVFFKKFGKVAVNVVKKFGSSIVKFFGGRWEKGFATKNGKLIVGINRPKKNGLPIICLGNQKGLTESSFLDIMRLELNEVRIGDVSKKTDDTENTDRMSTAKAIRKADIETGEQEPLTGINNPRITMDLLAQEILPEYISAAESRVSYDQFIPSFLMIGPPGIGKTWIINSMKNEGWNIRTMELSKTESFAVTGLPIIDEDDKGRKITRYIALKNLPPTNDNGKWVMFFDEFNRTKSSTLNAVMNLMFKGEIPEAEYSFPKQILVVLAANAGDREIDTEKIDLIIPPTLYGRMSETFILRRGMSKGHGVDIDTVESEGSPIIFAGSEDLPPDRKNVNIKETLGAESESKAQSAPTFFQTTKNPIDNKIYSFYMGFKFPPILENWYQMRSAGNEGEYEKSEFYKELQDTVKWKPTGKGFSFAVKQPKIGPLSDTEEASELAYEISDRDMYRLANAMKRSALHDFMWAYLFHHPLPSALVSNKSADDYANEWRNAGYRSAPHYFFYLNQEYYLQKKATVIPTKDKTDQDVFVQDVLSFYKKSKEEGRILDTNTALFMFSSFTDDQVKDILNIVKAIDTRKEVDNEKKKSLKRIIDIRTSFSQNLVEILQTFNSVDDFRKKANKQLDLMEKNIPDISNVVNVKEVRSKLGGSDEDVIDYAAQNIEKVLQIFKIEPNDLVNVIHAYNKWNRTKDAHDFAMRVIQSLRGLSDTFEQTEKSQTQAATLKKDIISKAGGFQNWVSQEFSDNPSSSLTPNPTPIPEPSKKRGRGRPKKNKTKLESKNFLVRMLNEINGDE